MLALDGASGRSSVVALRLQAQMRQGQGQQRAAIRLLTKALGYGKDEWVRAGGLSWSVPPPPPPPCAPFSACSGVSSKGWRSVGKERVEGTADCCINPLVPHAPATLLIGLMRAGCYNSLLLGQGPLQGLTLALSV